MANFLFPGQGSQNAGMGHLFVDHSPHIFERARAILPLDVYDAMFDAPQETLNDTRNAQPALVCMEMAAFTFLSELGITPDCCAGHSLGEISALTAVGALQFEDALRLAMERSRLMSEEVPPGGMMAVLGMDAATVESLLPENTQVANYNGPAQTIVSGTNAGLEETEARLREAGIRRILRLPVSGPFHSRFMREAADKLAHFLEIVPVTPPAIPFLSSVSGAMEDSPERIKTLLAKQLYSPVRWTQVMEHLESTISIEVGPGAVLKGLAKRMPEPLTVYAADTPDTCLALRELLENS